MSNITDLILTCSPTDYYFKIDELNTILQACGFSTFKKCASIHFATINYLPFDWLIAAIESVEWDQPQRLQLFYRLEHEDRFSEYKDLKPNKLSEFGLFKQNGKFFTERIRKPLEPIVKIADKIGIDNDNYSYMVMTLVYARLSNDKLADYLESIPGDIRDYICNKLEVFGDYQLCKIYNSFSIQQPN